jgi:3-methyl-2-oxobutanoate hydroxymethyltransferase
LGLGSSGDVIMSFVADICGQDSEEEQSPKDAHAFGDVGRLQKKIHQERISAFSNFNSEVKRNNFPYPETNISMHTDENEKLFEPPSKLPSINH